MKAKDRRQIRKGQLKRFERLTRNIVWYSTGQETNGKIYLLNLCGGWFSIDKSRFDREFRLKNSPP
jgi:hypothetical protein